MKLFAPGLFAAIVFLAGTGTARAQQTTVAAPHPVAGHSFYEQLGTSWGLHGNGWFFQFGGPVAPPFGGFDPNAGATFGFAGPHGYFNLFAGQGSSTTLSGQTPMVTVMNGASGAFFDQTLRPFVTGITPVVGGQPPVFSSVLQERLSRLETGEVGSVKEADGAAPETATGGTAKGPSSAERGELSVAEIKARKAAEHASAEAAASAEIESHLEKARAALAAGKPGVARIYLQMAARRVTGQQQAAIQSQIEELTAKAVLP